MLAHIDRMVCAISGMPIHMDGSYTYLIPEVLFHMDRMIHIHLACISLRRVGQFWPVGQRDGDGSGGGESEALIYNSFNPASS